LFSFVLLFEAEFEDELPDDLELLAAAFTLFAALEAAFTALLKLN
jgi:hypothetical protein